MSYTSVLEEVGQEITRAREVHGTQPFHSAHEGIAIVEEEYDELWDEVKVNPLKAYMPTYLKGLFMLQKDKDAARAVHRRRMRKEVIQLAAMAVRFAEEVCYE